MRRIGPSEKDTTNGTVETRLWDTAGHAVPALHLAEAGEGKKPTDGLPYPVVLHLHRTSAYPPDKAAIIGPHSGPLRCTMQTSTDLVNWATATNDIVYPDSETARFFRITLQREVNP